MSQRLLVVSDLHVTGPDDRLYASLLRLLEAEASTGDTLVLAGDLFDLFVGLKPIYRDRYRAFIGAAEQAARRGVALHYIEGNHDFYLARALRDAIAAGLQIHKREIRLELGGRRFYIAHGDLVDRADRAYLAWRAFFRSPLAHAALGAAPDRWVDWFGKTSSERSRARKPDLPARLPTGRLEALRRTYRNFAAERLLEGHDYVVLGHCHDLDEMSFQIDGRPGQYINVGYPRAHGSYLTWQPGDLKIQRTALAP